MMVSPPPTPAGGASAGDGAQRNTRKLVPSHGTAFSDQQRRAMKFVSYAKGFWTEKKDAL